MASLKTLTNGMKILDSTPTDTGGQALNDNFSIAISDAENGNVISIDANTSSNKPSAGTKGRIYYETDSGQLFYDDGSNWLKVADASGDSTNYEIQSGNESNKPSAGTQGRIYLATDTNKILYDNGSNWIDLAEPVKQDTDSNLSSVVIEQGRLAYATDTTKIAVGDGSTSFSNLADISSSVVLDLDDDGSNESSSISEIASINDSNNIMSEPSNDKLLFDFSKNYPQADNVTESNVDHNNLNNYVSNEHINHSNVDITAGDGLSGGGDITSSRTINVNIGNETNVTAADSDELIIEDASDNSNIKKTTAKSIADLSDSSVKLDLGDDGSNESTNVSKLRTKGDDNSFVTEPANDEVLFNFNKAVPKSDGADASFINEGAAISTPQTTINENSNLQTYVYQGSGKANNWYELTLKNDGSTKLNFSNLIKSDFGWTVYLKFSHVIGTDAPYDDQSIARFAEYYCLLHLNNNDKINPLHVEEIRKTVPNNSSHTINVSLNDGSRPSVSQGDDTTEILLKTDDSNGDLIQEVWIDAGGKDDVYFISSVNVEVMGVYSADTSHVSRSSSSSSSTSSSSSSNSSNSSSSSSTSSSSKSSSSSTSSQSSSSSSSSQSSSSSGSSSGSSSSSSETTSSSSKSSSSSGSSESSGSSSASSSSISSSGSSSGSSSSTSSSSDSSASSTEVNATMTTRAKPPIQTVNYEDPQANELVVALPFWEGSGDPFDYSGNAINVIREGEVYWVLGRRGYALEFNGEQDRVDTNQLPSDLNVGGSKPKTATGWCYTRAFNNAGIFYMGDSKEGEDFAIRTKDSDNEWRAEHAGSTYGSSSYYHDFTYDSKNIWVHFALVYDGTTSIAYVDGNQISSKDISINTTDNYTFRVGEWFGYEMDAIIEDVRLYDRALTDSEIKDIYEHPYRLYRHPDITTIVAPTTGTT